MVGVPGKFKGCETCRLRRVKCDNTRPFCKKCKDTGRQCAGYERDTVFIVGTIKDGGRCSSHPPRAVKAKTAGSSNNKRNNTFRLQPANSFPLASSSTLALSLSGRQKDINRDSAASSLAPISASSWGHLTNSSAGSPPQLTPVKPLQPAWDECILLSNGDGVYQTHFAALFTNMAGLGRQNAASGGAVAPGTSGEPFMLSPYPAYKPASVQPPRVPQEDFWLRAQCLAHLAGPSESPDSVSVMSVYLILYEHNASVVPSALPPWKDPVVQNCNIRKPGPGHFTTFPAHHFFARIYRPSAVSAALLNRKNTFLSDHAWISTPWEQHPKSELDRLWDVVVLLPAILNRADHITPHEPTMTRRLMAQDLLANCLHVERQLEQWHSDVVGHRDTPRPYWINDPLNESMALPLTTQIPFLDSLAFRNAASALMLVHYWMALILLHSCIESLHIAMYQPVPDPISPNSPICLFPHQLSGPLRLLDPGKYVASQVREIAALVCSSLDYTLATTVQPDLLAAPLLVVQLFYQKWHAATGDGELELGWCKAFEQRLAVKGEVMAAAFRMRHWVDAAQF